MDGKITVRIAQESDIKDISEITFEAFSKYAYDLGLKDKVTALKETEQDIKADMEKKTVLIGFMGTAPMGSIRFEIIGDIAYISRFGVKLMAQGRGMGRALMHEVEARCRSLGGIKAIALHTSSRMASLVRFYYGQGYFIHSTATDRGYIRALMVKELNGSEPSDYAAIAHK